MDYWKQVITDYLECSDDFYKDVDVDKIAEELMDDDNLWDYIYDCIERRIRE